MESSRSVRLTCRRNLCAIRLPRPDLPVASTNSSGATRSTAVCGISAVPKKGLSAGVPAAASTGGLTFDSLLSGFIGAVIGAVLVILWERWVWSRENRAAARIVYSELQMNEAYLDVARKRDVTALTMLGTAAWEAEQV